ncbi:very short patch repair endonuclease [Ramlibacter sp.]|uniref:very short patch repair endonuclease n=1 Tax=Ramlibacter sp. TaxID=1917967 RepID=UPI002CE87DD0|nr:very short patch repair endonuclease [Ramlibacter sp.]HWI81516.1 very short patch repair endonuclease [Ramlibacter sp.]
MAVDPARSAQMALVRSKDTKPEMRVRRALHAAGLRYVLHDRRLPGAPDLVFPSRGVALFVHGCFWHRHENCVAARLPKSRLDFWGPKLAANAERDQRQERQLAALGWTVIVVWECETKSAERLERLATQIRSLRPKAAAAIGT